MVMGNGRLLYGVSCDRFQEELLQQSYFLVFYICM